MPVNHLAEVCVVPELSNLMEPDKAILGAFNLRESLVPLLDIEALSDLPGRPRSIERAAVLKFKDRITAVAVDEIVSLSDADQIDTRFGMSGSGTAGHGDQRLFGGGFVLDGKVVNCLDVEKLFSNAQVPSVSFGRGTGPKVETASSTKYLIFTSGGAHFGVDAAHISATVPRKTVDSREIGGDGGLCMGFIDHHGWKVPVVNASRVLGLGDSDAPRETETVVLRFPGDKLLALSVDATERLSNVPLDRLKPSSPILTRHTLLPRVFVAETGAQVYVLDFEDFCRRPDIASIAALSTRSSTETESAPRKATDGSGIVREAVRYLIFDAGHKRAVPAAQISRILPMPTELTPPGDMPPSVKGVFPVGDRSVPLVVLHDGASEGLTESYVLLVSLGDHVVGFVAERICSIQTSQWRSSCDAVDRIGASEMVQVIDRGETMVLPVSDLLSVARSLSATAAKD
ncbi:hypothetical protein GQ651_08725 [Alphaproteobacteria bacterium GH1-50]|uniref:CheW-like domain-containing protein n=1 Tax=Kangsaoukella pontilimi TaxID=2691042 RepID=A0A7C9IFZ8_9RHOB|nr:hypothetical protein [Kangsaoukella pontilimi]